MLELDQVVKSFSFQKVLNDFSAVFDKGTHLIVGRNGSGKTTLLNILSGLTLVDSGTVLFNNTDIQQRKKEYLSKINIVMAGTESFFLQLTGQENLEFFSLCNNEELDLVAFAKNYPDLYSELSPLLSKEFHSFSSGMKRKLSLFRALVSQKEIILLDEPFAHLDKGTIELVASFIGKNSDRIFIIATHRQDLFCDMTYKVWEL